MIILANTVTTLQAVTNSNNSIVYTTDWDDLNGLTTTLGRGTNTGIINTNTTTVLTGSPAPGVMRSVKQITIKNAGNSNATILLQKNDGTTAWDISANVVLPPQYVYLYVEAAGYLMFANNGIPLQ